MTSREDRVVKNEMTARDLNEQIENAHDDALGGYLRVLCECGHDTCERVLAITHDEYAELRRHPRRFAVVQVHVIEDVEDVVAETERFVVVAKPEGSAADVTTARNSGE